MKLTDLFIKQNIDLDFIIDSIPGGAGVYQVMPDGHFSVVYCSDGLTKMIGYTDEEYIDLINNKHKSCIFETDEKSVEIKLLQCAYEKKVVKIFYRSITKTGNTIWTQARFKYVGDKDGFPCICGVFSRSVDETKIYGNIIDNSSDIIQVSDYNTYELLYVNEAAAKFAKKSKDAYLGQCCYEYFMNRTSPCEFCNKLTMTEGHCVKKNNHVEKHYKLTYKKLKLDGREAFAEYVTDVTEKIIAQQNIENENIRLSKILDMIPTGIAVFRHDEKGWHALAANKALGDILGVTKDDIYGAKIGRYFKSVHNPNPTEYISNMDDLIYCNKRVTFEFSLFNRMLNKNLWVYVEGVGEQKSDNSMIAYFCVHDITESKEKAIAYAEQSMELGALIKSVPGGIFKYSADDKTKIKYISPNFLTELGYTEEEFEEKFNNNFIEMVYVDDRNQIKETISTQLIDNQYYFCEYRIEAKDGSLMWWYAVGHLVVDANGEKWIYVVVANITKRKKLETQLQSEIARNNALIANTPGGACCMGIKKGNVVTTYVSESMARLFGYTREELLNMLNEHASELVNKEDLAALKHMRDKFMKNGETFAETFRIIRKDGREVWVNLRANPVKDKKGLIWYGSYTDITRQKVMESRLRDSEKSLAIAVRDSELNYWEYDLQTHRVIQGIEHENGFSMENVIDNFPKFIKTQAAIYPDDVDMYLSNLKKIENGVEYIEFEARFKENNSNEYQWKRVRYTTLFDKQHRPVKAIATAQNIADFKKLEERFVNSIVLNKIYTWEYDIKHHKIVKYNYPAGAYPFGYDDALEIQNIPQSVLEDGIIHKESMNAYVEMYRRIENGEKQVRAQIYAKSSNHKDFAWYDMAFNVIEEENGKPLRAICTCRDISSEKRAEQLYQYEQTYRYSVVESIVSFARVNLTRKAIEEIDNNLGITISKSLYNELDYRKRMDAFIDFSTLLDSDNNELSFDNLINSFYGGVSTITKEYLARIRSTSKYRFIKTTVKMLENPLTGEIMAFFYDIDRTEDFIVNGAVNTILKNDYDYAGIIITYNNHMYIMSKNPNVKLEQQYTDDYDKRAAEFLWKHAFFDSEKKYWDLVEGLSIKTVKSKLQKTNVYTFEYEYKIDDKTTRRKQMRFSYADTAKTIIAVNRIDIEDVVEKEKEKQEQLEKALSDAEHANNAKSEFLSTISHEIRTPLNIILGLAELAQKSENDLKTVMDYMNRIKISGTHLLSLISDVLDMSKIEHGEFKIRPEPMVYSSFESKIRALVEPLCKQKEITFIMEDTDEHFPVYADELRLNQVIFNLLSNAVKFTPKGGMVKYRYEHEVYKKTIKSKFIIEDNGIGMTPEFQQRLFKPFMQENDIVLSSTQGTGLGLSIAKGIVDKMGGTITCESTKGKGTKFVVSIDCMRVYDSNGIGMLENVDEIRFDGSKILVVEDHPLNQMILSKLLIAKGASVVKADNGKIGVEKYKQSAMYTFDAVLMDVRMPVLDGLEATKQIRSLSRPDAQSVPIIALTANAYDDDREKSKAAGMNEHLAKPVEPKKLYTTLKYLMEKNNMGNKQKT